MRKKPNRMQKEFFEELKHYLAFKTKCCCPVNKVGDYQQIIALEAKIMETQNIEEIKRLYREIYNFGISTILTLFPLFPLYDFLKDAKGGLRGLKEEQIINFLFLMAQSRKTSTLLKYATLIRNFFDFLDRKRGFSFDFFLKNLSFLGARQRLLPKHLPKEDLIHFIKTLLAYEPTRDYEKRNKVILLLITLGGLRSAEAFDLKAKDINVEEEHFIIHIIGKGHRERKIYIKRQLLQDALNDWLQCPTRLNYFSGEFLFKKAFSKTPQKKVGMRFFVLKIYQKAGLKNFTAYGRGLHIFRHSFATFLYGETQDLLLTSRSLGHQTVESTKIYIHTGSQQNKKTTEIFDRYL